MVEYWETGMVEYWNVGKLDSVDLRLFGKVIFLSFVLELGDALAGCLPCLYGLLLPQHSNIPIFHYSSLASFHHSIVPAFPSSTPHGHLAWPLSNAARTPPHHLEQLALLNRGQDVLLRE